MSLFDLSDYNVRQLDPAQGTKPLDFGGGGITGSINLDGRFIAINTYHPEHGYVTLTSIPPFPDEDRYDQQKVRAYRKSLVHNEGFGLQFEQEIIKREYFLIEDSVPFIRFTLADGTIAECVVNFLGTLNVFSMSQGQEVIYRPTAIQNWKFSRENIKAKHFGRVWIQRAAYTQLTEGGIVASPSNKTIITLNKRTANHIENPAIPLADGSLTGELVQNEDGSIGFSNETINLEIQHLFGFRDNIGRNMILEITPSKHLMQASIHKKINTYHEKLIISRSRSYASICHLHNGCMITDHMILPLLWNRDSYYVAKSMLDWHPDGRDIMLSHLQWLFDKAWRGTFVKRTLLPDKFAWARSYMANGMPKDNKAFQFDQQLFPFLELADYFERFPETNDNDAEWRESIKSEVQQFIKILRYTWKTRYGYDDDFLILTDETPADDELSFEYHFSSQILLWYTLKKLQSSFAIFENSEVIESLRENTIKQYFWAFHKGREIFPYAIRPIMMKRWGSASHNSKAYLYHDANDIPLVMMPLWGFCEKDDDIWRNTIDFAFSDDNPGFYDGVLGSVHSPAPWALGDAQELIYCKVIGDRERYQRVWERLEKVAQWDGALPEAYNISDYSVYSRHWFAWPNAMVAIADSIPWNWEEEGEYAR